MPLFGTTSACTYELTVFLESHTIKYMYYIATCSSLCLRPESCPLGDLYSLQWNIFDIHTHVLNNIKVEVSVSTPVHIHT